MRTITETEQVTTGNLVKDLQRLEKEHSDCNVVCILPDDTNCYITGVSCDADGSICITVEEDDFAEGIYDVDMLLAELESHGKDTKVYIDVDGYCLGITMNGDSLFTYDDFNDEVYCTTEVVGECQKQLPETVSYADRLRDKLIKEKRRRNIAETIVLVILTILLAAGLCYNLYAAVSRTGSSLVENILWSIVCLFLMSIGALTLYYSRD